MNFRLIVTHIPSNSLSLMGSRTKILALLLRRYKLWRRLVEWDAGGLYLLDQDQIERGFLGVPIPSFPFPI